MISANCSKALTRSRLTSSNPVDLVLYKEVYERCQVAKEASCKKFSVTQGPGIVRVQSNATERPRNRGYQIGYHENVVPVMVVCRRHIRPPSASQGSKKTGAEHKFGQDGIGTSGHGIVENDKGKTGAFKHASACPVEARNQHTRCYGNEQLENSAFRISVPNRSRHRGKPLVRVPLKLHVSIRRRYVKGLKGLHT